VGGDSTHRLPWIGHAVRGPETVGNIEFNLHLEGKLLEGLAAIRDLGLDRGSNRGNKGPAES
jgi:hypothetical protein